MTRVPDFRELVGADVAPNDEARLRRVHDLLVAAGPPPELTPALEHAPVPGLERAPQIEALPPRRRGRVLTLALGFAAVTLVVGYIFGARGGGFDSEFSVPMHATAAAPGASAVIDVAAKDEVGNWQLKLDVRGLPLQPEGSYYELYLTRPGAPRVTCGTFRMKAGTTTVRLNAPYSFKRPYGWVVVAQTPGQPPSKPLLSVHIA